jgi:CheY-like chemotaxis protein
MRSQSDVIILHATAPVRPDEDMAGTRSIEAQGASLERERSECQANLARLNADLDAVLAKRAPGNDAAQPASPDRLRVLASMDPELRSPLHTILGYAQLLCRDDNLSETQLKCAAAILVAGKHLLEKLHDAVGLADGGTETGAWHIDELDRGAVAAVRGFCAATSEWSPGRTAQARGSAPPCVLHVLVVDDIAMNRDIASAFIRAAGHTAVTAEGGAPAVAAAAAADFDVILMDIRMPEMDGFEATRRIRALDGRRGRVPIVALTSMAFQGDVEDCRAAGMSGHLAKPFGYETLNEAILLGAAARQESNGGARRPVTAPGGEARIDRVQSASRADARFAVTSKDTRTAQPWIDIPDPWNGMPLAMRPDADGASGRYIIDTQFAMKLVSIGDERSRRLVDTKRSCVPPTDRGQHEFHWLLYTDERDAAVESFSARCDLWRWSNRKWCNISVPGAHFSPDEMYEHGWRYCGPCADKTASVQVM